MDGEQMMRLVRPFREGLPSSAVWLGLVRPVLLSEAGRSVVQSGASIGTVKSKAKTSCVARSS